MTSLRSCLLPAYLAFVMALLIAFVPAFADEEEVEIKDLPSAVAAALKARFPKAELEEAAKEVEDGKTIYEVEIEDDDATRTVSVSSAGKILEIETELDGDEIPAFILQAVEARYPKAEIEKAEQAEVDGHFTYELLIEKADGDHVELVLAPAVAIISEKNIGKEKAGVEKKDKD